MSQFVIVIATYRRAGLLRLLLEDALRQTVCPKVFVIVDGDPDSGEVLAMLEEFKKATTIPIWYIPSNYGNLAYQRYLGWKCARELPIEFLVYFDDDIRLKEQTTLATLLSAFRNLSVVGVTAQTITGGIEKFSNEPALVDMRRSKNANWIVEKLGSARKFPKGGYTPVGNRILPDPDEPLSIVRWLQGRVMAYRMNAIDQSCFLEDLFALTHVHCGLGEDSILSRQVGRKGELVLVHGLTIEHPDDALPNSYPIKAYNLAYASAYSRRFLNDHYCISGPPHFSDRLALLKSYLGNNLINLVRAISHPARHRFAYAWGYFCGSVRGIVQKPTAKNLTPHINWSKDAEEALAGQVMLN